MTASARAAVVYSGLQDIPIPTNLTGVYVEVLNGGPPSFSEDIGFVASDVNFFLGGSGIGNSPSFQPVRTGTGILDPVAQVELGSMVDATSTFASGFGGSENAHIGPAANQFKVGEIGQMGFKIEDGGNTHYGFMRVELGNAGTPGNIVDWYYESTPDTAITVVPEPSTATLAGLAAAGLLWCRRRSVRI